LWDSHAFSQVTLDPAAALSSAAAMARARGRQLGATFRVADRRRHKLGELDQPGFGVATARTGLDEHHARR
jgi:hypothetical protein